MLRYILEKNKLVNKIGVDAVQSTNKTITIRTLFSRQTSHIHIILNENM